MLIAKTDIDMGQALTPADDALAGLADSATTGSFIRKNERPERDREARGSIARAPFTAGEPIREAKLIKAKGSGFMAAILPSGMRAVSTEIRRKPAPAASSCRTTAST